MNILIVEDDPLTSEILKECLESEGFAPFCVSSGTAAIDAWKTGLYSLICLDIMIPELDGYEVCRKIRKKDSSTPILFLSAKNDEIDVVAGLQLGADDFLRKPFGKKELIARIRSATRRVNTESDNNNHDSFVMFDQLLVTPKQLSISNSANPDLIEQVSPREIAILQLFRLEGTRVVSRDEFFDFCWGLDYYPESRTLDQFISRIRRKLNTLNITRFEITSVRGIGYRITTHELSP